MGLTHKFFFSLKSTRCTENKDEGYIGGEKEEREQTKVFARHSSTKIGEVKKKKQLQHTPQIALTSLKENRRRIAAASVLLFKSFPRSRQVIREGVKIREKKRKIQTQ